MLTNKKVRKMYAKFNKEFFDNKLPKGLRVHLVNMDRVEGFEECWGYADDITEIAISDQATANNIEAIMLHEMIHVWQTVFFDSSIKDHGKEFKRKAKELETKTGLSMFDIGE